MSHKIFDNNLVAIRKTKLSLKLLETCTHWNVYLGIE